MDPGLSMRVIALVALLIAYAGVAAAQTRPTALTPWSLPPIGLPLPPIGLPLSPIGLPLPTIGLPPGSASPPPQPSPRVGDRVWHGPKHVSRPIGVTGIIVVPQYWWEVTQPNTVAPPSTVEPAPASVERRTGMVRLAIVPTDAQLFVNDEYVGTVEDFNGEIALEEGSHTLGIRARGYEPQKFRVKIDAGRAISYTGALVRIPEAEPPSPGPPTHDTFYYIPGCYMGNIPPEQMKLPAGCDLSRLITSKR